MNGEGTGAGMQLAGSIFNEMVMNEAIKDKTVQVQKQMMDEEGNHVAGFNQNELDGECEKDEGDSDSDFNDDDDAIMRTLREAKMKEMKARHAEHQENMRNGHGKYEEITEEQFLPCVTKTKFVVVHFYHKDFERCKVMDKHLGQIAREHVESKFVKIDAEKCPFFVAKLQIQMLPTVICFMDGVAFDRIIGFEELGGHDEFPTLLLSRRLVKTGCIKALTKKEKGDMVIKKAGRKYDSESSDNDVNDDY